MVGGTKKGAVALIAIVLVLAFAGCGGGSSTADGGTVENEGSSQPSKEFLGPKKKQNSPALFGQVGSAEELEQVSQIVGESLKAREVGDWAGQCATLSMAAQKKVAEAAEKQKGCSAQLEALGKDAPKFLLRDNMAGSVAVFRFKGITGYALYHGDDQKDWAMPMEKEGAEWKVGALLAQQLSR
ncbi:MAG TPA: hypothetical protein VGI73_08035 [Solirubrobacterales bacterium]